MSGPLLITEVQFKCNGCGARWHTHLDVPLTSAVEIGAFLKDPTRMSGCPRVCGGRTADVAFKLPQATTTDHKE
jgi:hypothetical protein